MNCLEEKRIRESFDNIQGIIGEYESKTNKPTIEGFSMFLERKKQFHIQKYKEYCLMKKARCKNGKS